ncbi:FdhE protein [Salmonella enterica subsp. enterica]|uniref:FdhE protein n=1 Tax=Salmonella enterica I TaxID=59201 RepID=A0A3S4FY38_SALET|nr:FdhE protein [Salmonella enterica subsp. enterica]
MASLIPGKARAEYGEARQYCPVCGSMPVSSMVQIGTTQGLRYLHCNLCETEWHVVRVKCSNCEQSRDLHYWSLENEQAAVKAESCGDCGTYLKISIRKKTRKWKQWPTTSPRWCWTRAWSRKGSPAVPSTRSCSRGKGNKFFTQTGRSLPSGLQVIRCDHSRNIGKVFCITRHKLTTMDLCSGQNDRIREFHAILLPDNDASLRDFLCYANNIERT